MWCRRLLPVFIILFFIVAVVGALFGPSVNPQDLASIVMLLFLFGMASLFCYLFGIDTPYDSKY